MNGCVGRGISNAVLKTGLVVLLMLILGLSTVCLSGAAASGGFFSGPEVTHISPRTPDGVAAGNGTFVVIEPRGVILTSTNGMDWEQQLFPETRAWSVAYGNGQFLITATDPAIERSQTLISLDGRHWTLHPSDLPPSIFRMSYGNGRFVVLSYPYAYLSQDGLTWQRSESPYDGLREILCGNGTFLMFNNYNPGSVLASTDGLRWVESNAFEHEAIRSVAAGAGVFVANSFGHVWRSEDGLNWTPLPFPAADDTQYLWSVTFANGRFILSGGIYSSNPSATPLAISLDGTNWISQPTSGEVPTGPVVEANGAFVSVDVPDNPYTPVARGILRSTDGMSWSRVIFPEGFGVFYTACTWWKDRFFALGYDSDSSVVGESSDGRGWAFRRLFGRHRVLGLTGTDERLVGVGDVPPLLPGQPRPDMGVVLSSADGTNWSSASIASGPVLNAVARSPGRIVAVGDRGRILSSSDAREWDEQFRWTALDLVDVAYGNGVFVAIGGSRRTYESSVLLSSPDGLTWTPRGPASGNILQGVAFGSGRFVVGRWNGPYLTSTNGLDWIEHPSTVTLPTQSVSLSSLIGADYIGGWFLLRVFGGGAWSAWNSADLQEWSKFWAFGAEYVVFGMTWGVEPASQMGFNGRTVVLPVEQYLIRFDLQRHPFAVSLLPSSSAVSELGEASVLTLRRTGSDKLELPVHFAITGTAEERTDYESIGSTLVIPAGHQSVQLPIRALLDQAAEPAEFINIQVEQGENYDVTDQGSATILIHDSGTAPRLRPSAVDRRSDGSVHLTIEVPAPGLCTIERSVDLSEWQPVGDVQSKTTTVEFVDHPGESRQLFYRIRFEPAP